MWRRPALDNSGCHLFLVLAVTFSWSTFSWSPFLGWMSPFLGPLLIFCLTTIRPVLISYVCPDFLCPCDPVLCPELSILIAGVYSTLALAADGSGIRNGHPCGCHPIARSIGNEKHRAR